MTAPLPALAPAAPRAAGTRVQRVTSPGGIEAWLVSDETLPLVAASFAFVGGASQDPPGRGGLAAVLAALLDEGAGELDDQAFQTALEERAIELNFTADHELVSGSLRTLSRHLDEAVRLARLALNEPRFDPEPFARVKAQIVAGLRNEAKNPNAMASKAFAAAAFPEHPAGRPARGTEESLAVLTRDDVVAAHKRLLTRDALKVSLVGAITPERAALLLDEMFGDLPATGDRAEVAPATLARAGERVVQEFEGPQSIMVFGGAGIPRRDPDFIAATLVANVLGGGFSSRLFREVREKRGLAYTVYSTLNPFALAPAHVGGTTVKKERALESLDVIGAEIADLAANGPKPEELERSRKYLMGSYALAFDTSTKIASQLVRMQLDGRPIDYMTRRNELVAAVTPDDAARVAKRLYGDGQLLVSIVGRPEGA